MRRRIWVVLRGCLLVLLLGQGIHYAIDEARERGALRRLAAERVGTEGDALARLVRSTETAFDIPTHRRVHVDYGLKHPLMKILRPSAMQVYRHGGHCAKRSRLLAELLRVQGIPAHKLYLYNPLGLELLKDPPRAWVHVVVEAKVGDRWVVADPLFNLVFRLPDGRPASAGDLARDRELLADWRRRADERFDVWEDRLYFYDDLRRVPWFTVPILGEKLRAVLVRTFGAARVDAWVAPGWMERPQLQIALGSFAAAALVGLSFLPRRRLRRAEADAGGWSAARASAPPTREG